MKRTGAFLLTGTMLAVWMTGCGSSTGDSPASDDGKVAITIFNTKSEIQDQMVEMAEKYSKEKGVSVEVYYSNDPPATHLSTKYASDDPYTISMVDAKNITTLGAEHGIDLSDEKWVDDTEMEIRIDDKVYGFPVCVEGRGLMYNADAIEKITGKAFAPESITNLDEFEDLLEELAAGGMKSPVGIQKEDWSLAAHYLAEIYDKAENPDAYVEGLHDGSINIAEDDSFNALMDTFDVLMKYNYAKDSAVAAERELTEQKFAEGEIAFLYGGNWDWSLINAYDYTENMGIMPVPENIESDTKDQIAGGATKFFYIDSSDEISDKEREAARDFLNWLVYDEEGQKFVTEDCNMISPFSTNSTLEVSDPLSKSVQSYLEAGKITGMYDYQPDDYYTVVGASFQKYLAGQMSRSDFAKDIQTYWKNTALVEH
ncbi:ABC transporter substrate-binding protein [Marvinbryantia formatexigens]|nr:ABC transporter substrate-binding protein [Marvinbryantia formatexigens]